MGHEAANKVRKVNNSDSVVNKKEVFDSKKGYFDTYKRKSIK